MTGTLDRKRAKERRRREVLARRPEHYCPRCTATLYRDDEACLECEQARPAQGWPDLRDSMDPWLGRVLEGRYLLTRRIGQGASASVFRAESLAISRQFAIKIIHPPKGSNGPSPEQIAARLEREIEALGRLRNPHIVRFYDVIELPLHHIGVVMDFVEGDTLEDLVVQENHLSVARASTLLRQIANGVYEAHLVGMTHRDLKPENIMVEQLPAGDDFVHVLDFGIVQVEGEVSMTQGFIGTPLYASPEQAMGEHVDHRSDIYSLGAIFFFMLCGQPPFMGQNVMQVLRQHVEEPPPRISDVRPDMGVPAELEALIAQMLAKEVEDRPPTLAEVIHLLDKLSYSTSENTETFVGDGAEISAALRESSASSEAALAAPTESDEAWPREDHESGSTSQGVPFASVARVASSVLDDEDVAADLSGEMPVIDQDARKRTGSGAEDPRTGPVEPAPEPAPTPRSGIFGRVRRPSSSGRLGGRVSSPEPATPPVPRTNEEESPSLHEHTRPGLPSMGEVDLSPGATLTRVACARDYRFAYLHDGELHIWRMQPREHQIFSIRKPGDVTAVSLAANQAFIGRASGKIEELDLKSGQVLTLFESVFSDEIADLAASADGKLLLAVMRSGRIYVSAANKSNDDWVRVRGGDSADALTLSPRGDLFAVARGDEIEVSRVAEPKQVRVRISTRGPVRSMAFTDDGYLLGVSRGDARVDLFQVINGKRMVEIDTGKHRPLNFFFSDSNSLMGFMAEDDKLFVADLQALQSS